MNARNESMFLVDKSIDEDMARSLAESYFNSLFSFHCANNNDIMSRFDYPQYRDRLKTHWIFIGIVKEITR